MPLAIGRMGGLGENGSGDMFIAFSTGNPGAWAGDESTTLDTQALRRYDRRVDPA